MPETHNKLTNANGSGQNQRSVADFHRCPLGQTRSVTKATGTAVTLTGGDLPSRRDVYLNPNPG
jgi:hypothetical protein